MQSSWKMGQSVVGPMVGPTSHAGQLVDCENLQNHRQAHGHRQLNPSNRQVSVIVNKGTRAMCATDLFKQPFQPSPKNARLTSDPPTPITRNSARAVSVICVTPRPIECDQGQPTRPVSLMSPASPNERSTGEDSTMQHRFMIDEEPGKTGDSVNKSSGIDEPSIPFIQHHQPGFGHQHQSGDLSAADCLVLGSNHEGPSLHLLPQPTTFLSGHNVQQQQQSKSPPVQGKQDQDACPVRAESSHEIGPNVSEHVYPIVTAGCVEPKASGISIEAGSRHPTSSAVEPEHRHHHQQVGNINHHPQMVEILPFDDQVLINNDLSNIQAQHAHQFDGAQAQQPVLATAASDQQYSHKRMHDDMTLEEFDGLLFGGGTAGAPPIKRLCSNLDHMVEDEVLPVPKSGAGNDTKALPPPSSTSPSIRHDVLSPIPTMGINSREFVPNSAVQGFHCQALPPPTTSLGIGREVLPTASSFGMTGSILGFPPTTQEENHSTYFMHHSANENCVDNSISPQSSNSEPESLYFGTKSQTDIGVSSSLHTVESLEILEKPMPKKRGRKKGYRSENTREEGTICAICGDVAGRHSYYGGTACQSCRAFFRRSVQGDSYKSFKCCNDKSQAKCTLDFREKKRCKLCRFKACLNGGMRVSYVISIHKKKRRKKSNCRLVAEHELTCHNGASGMDSFEGNKDNDNEHESPDEWRINQITPTKQDPQLTYDEAELIYRHCEVVKSALNMHADQLLFIDIPNEIRPFISKRWSEVLRILENMANKMSKYESNSFPCGWMGGKSVNYPDRSLTSGLSSGDGISRSGPKEHHSHFNHDTMRLTILSQIILTTDLLPWSDWFLDLLSIEEDPLEREDYEEINYFIIYPKGWCLSTDLEERHLYLSRRILETVTDQVLLCLTTLQVCGRSPMREKFADILYKYLWTLGEGDYRSRLADCLMVPAWLEELSDIEQLRVV